MSISPIVSSLSYSNSEVQQPSVTASSQRQPAALAGGQDSGYTVKISQLAQIEQMAHQGDSVSTIAGDTGLPVNQIDSDLDISTSTSSTPVIALTGSARGHAAAPSSASNGAPAAAGGSQAATPASTLSVRA